MSEKEWYNLEAVFGVKFDARDGFSRHLEPFIKDEDEEEDYDDEYGYEDEEKDILITSLLKYLDLTVRHMIRDKIIGVKWTIDLEEHIFEVRVCPLEDVEEFDFYAGLSYDDQIDHERERYLSGITMCIAAAFLKLEKDLYEKYQKEMVS